MADKELYQSADTTLAKKDGGAGVPYGVAFGASGGSTCSTLNSSFRSFLIYKGIVQIIETIVRNYTDIRQVSTKLA